MDLNQILSALDDQIGKLQQVRVLLATAFSPAAILAKRGPGRPKKLAPKPAKIAKRILSPEARKKIADAQKKRWAAAKKAAKPAATTPAKNVAAKKSPVKKTAAKKSSSAKTTEQA